MSQKADTNKRRIVFGMRTNGILNLLCLRSLRFINLPWAIVRQNGEGGADLRKKGKTQNKQNTVSGGGVFITAVFFSGSNSMQQKQ